MALRNQLLSCGFASRSDDVRVPCVDDTEHASCEQLPAGCSKIDVVPVEVVDTGFCKHGIVFHFGFSHRGAVVGNDDQLCLSLSQFFLKMKTKHDKNSQD